MAYPSLLLRGIDKVVRSWAGHAVLRRVFAAQYGPVSRIRGFDSLAYWLAVRQRMPDAERAQSVARTEGLFVSLVENLRPTLFIEAGAKDAEVSSHVKTLVPGLRAVAFEANPYTYRRFRKRHSPGTTGVEYLNIALGASTGETTFHVLKREDGKPRADGQSSLLERVRYANGYVEVTVQATTLDEFFPASEKRRCALWIDVEGATGLVLDGAKSLLADVQFLIVEVEERTVWQAQATRRDIVPLLRQHGLVPIARDFQSRHQFNMLFVTSDLRNSPALKASLDTSKSRQVSRIEMA